MKSFITKLSAITIGAAIAGWVVFSLFLPEYYLPVMPWMLIFFFVVTLLIYLYQLKLIKKDIGKFTRSNMVVTFLKLVLYSAAAIVYIAFDSENAIPFVVCMMLLYIIFNFFEVAEISRITRSGTGKK